MHLRTARRLLLILALGAAGCGSFRASAGVGIGIGGSVRAGPVDAGFLGGAAIEWGNAYGIVGSQVTGEAGLALGRVEFLQGSEDVVRIRGEGLAACAYRILADAKTPDERTIHSFFVNRPTEIAVSVYALVFAFHLGFDPAGLVRDLHDFFKLSRGEDADDPPGGAASPPPPDELAEPPYTVLSRDDLANLESGTAMERSRARRELDGLLQDGRALIVVEQIEDNDDVVERSVTARLAIDQLGITEETRDELAALRQDQARWAYERAEQLADPDALGDALGRFPLAREGARAAGLRGEYLLERGELSEAVAAFREAVARSSGDEEMAARRHLALASKLREKLGEAPSSGQAWAGSVDLGFRIAASGRSVWAMTAAGDIAWERSDALPQDFWAARVVGGSSGLALVEAFRLERAWILGVDDSGRVAWKTPLPAPSAGSGPMDQVYALGAGRVFAIRIDQTIAIEAATGRVLWMSVRRDKPVLGKPLKDVVPMEWVAPPGPARRRPDGARGFRVKLSAEELEVSSGTGRRVEVFDARTGKLLSSE